MRGDDDGDKVMGEFMLHDVHSVNEVLVDISYGEWE